MSAQHVEIFVTFFAAALALSIAAEGAAIPAPMLLVAVGALVHGFVHISIGFDFGPALLFVFLPPLIFEAAWNLDMSAVRQRLARILYLALPGTVFTAAITAGFAAVSRALPPPSALIFGAILAATDPVAVVGIFRRVSLPGTVKTIVEAESLANDGVAVVLYGLALQSALAPGVTPWQAWLWQPLWQIGSGIAVGALLAVPIWLALRCTRSSDYEVATTVVLAYVSFLSADRIHGSGIIAATAAAVALRTLLRRHSTLSHRDDVNVFWNASATLVNTFVFFATGLLIEPAHLLQAPLLVIAAVAGMLVSRAVLAATAAESNRARAVVFLAGMRGSLPLALALSLPATLPARELIINGVAAAVIVSLFINGIPLEPVLKRMYRGAKTPI